MDVLDDYSKNILTETLFLFQDVCKKLNIEFYLSHGTLLGAVKYKGFIPWEDDLDIMMRREDFNVLKNYFLENPHEDWALGGAECGFFSLDFFAKFFNKKYFCLEEGRLLTHPWVDIYILSEVKEKELKNYCKELKTAIAIGSLAHKKVKYTDWYDSELKIWFYYHFHQKEIIPIKWADNYLYKKLVKYVGKGDCYLLLSPGVFHIIEEKLYNKDWFRGNVLVEFEGREFQAPIDYDLMLKTTYGENYMNELPPEKERVFKHGTKQLRPNEQFVSTYKYLFD